MISYIIKAAIYPVFRKGNLNGYAFSGLDEFIDLDIFPKQSNFTESGKQENNSIRTVKFSTKIKSCHERLHQDIRNGVILYLKFADGSEKYIGLSDYMLRGVANEFIPTDASKGKVWNIELSATLPPVIIEYSPYNLASYSVFWIKRNGVRIFFIK